MYMEKGKALEMGMKIGLTMAGIKIKIPVFQSGEEQCNTMVFCSSALLKESWRGRKVKRLPVTHFLSIMLKMKRLTSCWPWLIERSIVG